MFILGESKRVKLFFVFIKSNVNDMRIIGVIFSGFLIGNVVILYFVKCYISVWFVVR